MQLTQLQMYAYDVPTTLTHHHHIKHAEGNQDLLFSMQIVLKQFKRIILNNLKERKQKSITGKRRFCNVTKDQQNTPWLCQITTVTDHPFPHHPEG